MRRRIAYFKGMPVNQDAKMIRVDMPTKMLDDTPKTEDKEYKKRGRPRKKVV